MGTLECLIDVLPLIYRFFPTQEILIPKTPPPSPPINYRGKFPTQTNLLKQYADFFCDLTKGTARLYKFCFASSFNETYILCCFAS